MKPGPASSDVTFPPRYEALTRLGTGGGGEVWAVRERGTGERRALKILADTASEAEMAALVREAAALSGLEGLGVPRVLHFGRLPRTGRPYLVRELVEGSSLQDVIAKGASLDIILRALVTAAEQVTRVHRAGFFHGDIKPANIICEPSGRGTLVDLGLAAPWQDSGTAARGLTPRYAAPELFEGKPLTVRAEIYAFGAALKDVLETLRDSVDPTWARELAAVADRATRDEPSERFPSADEFASALRRAARVTDQSQHDDPTLVWPVVGIEVTSSRLLEHALGLKPGSVLWLDGGTGSGRTTLLRRLSWSLGVSGVPLAWIDGKRQSSDIRQELAVHEQLHGAFVLVDDADQLDAEGCQLLLDGLHAGIRVIAVGDSPLNKGADQFRVPALGQHVASELMRRAVPSLTAAVMRRLTEHAEGRPGELRRLVGLIAANPVVSEEDVDHLILGFDDVARKAPAEPYERAVYLLERGRYHDVRLALAQVGSERRVEATIVQARLEVGLGEAAAAIRLFQSIEGEVQASRSPELKRAWSLWYGRSYIGIGNYQKALELIATVSGEDDALGIEAQAYEGLALSHLGETEKAKALLSTAVAAAQRANLHRVCALALACLGLVHQSRSENEQAREIYQRAIKAAEQAHDASTLGTVQLNLAALLRVNGDIAGALEHFEAAVDMGRRSGRRSTVRNALLNLANMDLYLGRVARARSSIEALEEQRAQLSPAQRAQLTGLLAELALADGEHEQAARHFEACAAAYDALGLNTVAAEALLEGVLVASGSERVDVTELNRQIAQAKAGLGDAEVHRHLLQLAVARVALAAGDEAGARDAVATAVAAAREAGQRDWMWRTLAARAEIEASGGQPLMARRDREEALTVLEAIAARLPRDLREVFWNDPRRRELRGLVEQSLGYAPTEIIAYQHRRSLDRQSSSSSPISAFTVTPLEQRLTRILEINRELLGEIDLDRLTSRVTEYAVELLDAERGFVLLREPDGRLTVRSSKSRLGDDAHADFSRSIAQQVMASREPVVTLNARQDMRMKSYASVHQLALESVACVPISARSGTPIGALYLETRQRSGKVFESEIPMLQAFADQVGLAIETGRLLMENRTRAEQLAETNKQLIEAQEHLQELLGERTQKLKDARRKLRDARDTLYGRFGYQGMVGNSAAMRRSYALIDRIKDADVTVLITGESGTGKEVAARAIHRASPRSKQPFLGINCGAIPEHLLESELFGHTRGAFTGADRERKGLIREAEGGCVLLDEIGEMPHKMQAGLLRVLQERMVRPVGGAKEEPVDVRFIFATHRDLEQLVKQGKFREDLYYRIHVVELKIPALRERREDIPALVDHFLGIFAARYRRDKKALTRDALRRLMAFDWPGNVRQLEHVLLNAWILGEDLEIDSGDLELPDGEASYAEEALEEEPASSEAVAPGAKPERSTQKTLSKHRRDEKEKILEALAASNWNRVKAAELSGIPRRTFYRRLREYNIQ